MTEENVNAKIGAAIILKPQLQAIADDEANEKNVRAGASVLVMFINDVLPLYKAESDRQHEELKRQVEADRPAREAAEARMKALLAASKPYKSPHHI